jgi:putative tryptophan/tyrosine transport system substrate-binding protein
MSLQLHDTATKRSEMLREVVSGLRRLAAIANVVNPSAALEMREVQTAASALDLEITTFEIRRPEDIATAFEALRGTARRFMSAPTRS